MQRPAVDQDLRQVAQAHANETGHGTIILWGSGWVCTTCDEDWLDLTVEAEQGRGYLGLNPEPPTV